MVLVRRRNEFVNALVRELKQANIEVAGVDRLNLGEELAVQDLLAMARFVLLPQDDLNLACLLKSPLIGLDEDELFTLAWKRTGHLWRSLRERARAEPFAAAHARLAEWLRRRRLHHAVRLLRQGARAGRRPRAACWSGSATRRPIRSTSCWRVRCNTSAPKADRCRASCAGSRRAAARSSATSTRTAGARCAS